MQRKNPISTARLFVTVFLIWPFANGNASSYYFSSTLGDDSRTPAQAQSASTPWKSLAKLNSYFSQLQPGDSVLFRSGDVFYGKVTVAKSGAAGLPIVLASYGSGGKPILSGFTVLSNWTLLGNGIWETTNASLGSNVSVLTVNDKLQPLGRYPNPDAANKGYLTFENHTATSVTDNELTGTFNWTGAEIVIRKNRWILDKAKVTQHNSNTVTFNASGYEPINGFGYFFQNHTNTLDQWGEWCYNAATKKVSIYFPAGLNPNTLVIKVSTIAAVAQVWNYSHVKFQNLVFEGANDNAVDLYGTTGITLANCRFAFNLNSLVGMNNSFLKIEESEFLSSLNNGALLWANNSSVRRSVFKNSGLVSGMGKSGDDTYQALILRGSSNTVERNVFDSTGYSAIRFEGDSALVQNNFVADFNLTKDDGGGIYTYVGSSTTAGKGSKIIGNIVLKGRGAGAGTNNPNEAASHGIYLDDNTGQVQVIGNTAAHCNGSGLFLHNAHENQIINNTFFDNELQLLMQQNSSNLIRLNRLYKNKFFAKRNTQMASKLISDADDIRDFGAIDSNYYCRPLDDKFVINTVTSNAGVELNNMHNLPEWKVSFKHDSLSKSAPVEIKPYALTAIIGSNKFANSGFTSNINGVSYWSASGNCTPQWSSGSLDGGCLKVSFNSAVNPSIADRSALITLDIGSVNAAKKYILKFSLLGRKSFKNFRLYLRKHDSPYNDLSPRYFCSLTTTRTENEYAFTFPTTESSAFLVFETTQSDSTFFVDNLQFYEANFTATDPDDHIRFEYNASDNYRTINLNSNSYIDAENRAYNGTLQLAPWASVALIKSTIITLPARFAKFEAAMMHRFVKLSWSTGTEPEGGNFEIEKSADGRTFTTIGNMPVINSSAAGRLYRFDDLYPFSGNNFYRIKLTDKQGRVAFTQVLLVVNGETKQKLSILPTPTKDIAFVVLPKVMTGEQIFYQMFTVTGVLIESKKLSVPTNPLRIDASALAKGFYVLKVSGPTQTCIASLVKD